MAKSQGGKKRPKRTRKPAGWDGSIKKEAARKAAQGPDLSKLSKTSVPEQVGHSDDTEVLPDKTVRMPGAETGGIEITSAGGQDPNAMKFKVAEDPKKDADIPPTEVLPPVQEDIPKTEPAIPIGPSQAERERIAAIETQVLSLDDTEDTVFVGTKTEELLAPTERLEAVVKGAKTSSRIRGVLSRIPVLKGIISYINRGKIIEESLRAQAAETETHEEPAPEAEEPVLVGEPEDATENIYVHTETEPLTEVESPAEVEEEARPEVIITTKKPEKKGLLKRLFGRKKKKDAIISKPGYLEDADVAPEAAVSADTEPLTDVEEEARPEDLESVAADSAAPEQDLEESIEEKASMYTVGVTFNEKYAPILFFAAGERAVVNEENRGLWEQTLEDLDVAYETADADERQEAEEFRNYLFAVYSSADGCKSKDKEVLIYVLSELARVNSEKGDPEKAFKYARRARQLGKLELLKAPNAETLHKWGMLEHNIKIYEKQMQENLVAAEAE